MNQNLETIQRIGQKLHQLVKQRDGLLRDKEKLQQELAQEKEDKKALAEKLNLLEEQVAILKSASEHMDEKEKKQFEKRINAYIKDIDKVIAHLQG
jgi:nucleosome binding factor SPN SPT16 subunit